MSLSLRMSQQNGGGQQQPPPRPSSSPRPSSQVIPPTQQPSPSAAPLASPSLPLAGSQSQGQARASAASRRKAAAAAAAAASIPSHSPDAPVAAAAADPSASAGDIRISATPTRASNTRGTPVHSFEATPAAAASAAAASPASKPASRSRASAADAIASSAAAAAPRAAAASAAAPAAVDDALPAYDDNSSTFLSPFVLEVGESGAAAFSLFTHYSPPSDSLQIFLLQKAAPPSATTTAAGTPDDVATRLFHFKGTLLSLRPRGLYMSGLRDEDYTNYVLHGLATQDSSQNCYEYELIVANEPFEPEGDDDDAPTRAKSNVRRKSNAAPAASAAAAAASGAIVHSQLHAQLRLYKRMGEKVTRVPVCIAILGFTPLNLTSDDRRHKGRQSEQQYKQLMSQMMASLAAWTDRLRSRRAGLDRRVRVQQEEQKVAEELLAFPPDHSFSDQQQPQWGQEQEPSTGRGGDVSVIGSGLHGSSAIEASLIAQRNALLSKALLLLNGKKSVIRALRESNAALKRERDGLKPKPPGAKSTADIEEISESESEGSDAEAAEGGDRKPEGMDVDMTGGQAASAAAPASSKATRSPEMEEKYPVSVDRIPTAASARSAGMHDGYDDDADLSFPASIDPASLGSFSPSFSQSGSMPQGTAASASAGGSSRPSRFGAPPSAPPSGGGGGLDDVLSPLTTKHTVRKRARVNAPPPQPTSLSQGLQSSASLPQAAAAASAGGSGSGERGSRRPSQQQGAAAAAAAAAPIPLASRDRSTSALLRELEGNQSRRPVRSSAHASASPDPMQASKKARSSRGTSGLLNEME